MFSDEKIFDQDGQINRQNNRVYAESRQAANEAGALKSTHKFPFKVMVWNGLSFYGPTSIVVLAKDTSFNSDFYISKVLPIAKRDGTRLIGDDFLYQQNGATCHTSDKSIEAIKKLGMRYIRPDIWPPNSSDLNPLDYFFGMR